MPEILFVYCGGKVPKTREEIEEIEESASLWMKWFKKNGRSLVDPGNPVGQSTTVGANGIEDGDYNPASVYTILRAPDFDTACEMARSGPVLIEGDTVEVAEIYAAELQMSNSRSN